VDKTVYSNVCGINKLVGDDSIPLFALTFIYSIFGGFKDCLVETKINRVTRLGNFSPIGPLLEAH
jgi:hypothetical protein